MSSISFARMAENPLANPGFEEGWIVGHPAYWMAEGRQPGIWIKEGQGVMLDLAEKTEGKQSLCLDGANVASLTSLKFPVRPNTAYVFSGNVKAEPAQLGACRTYVCVLKSTLQNARYRVFIQI
jgi:hypothetical protein